MDWHLADFDKRHNPAPWYRPELKYTIEYMTNKIPTIHRWNRSYKIFARPDMLYKETKNSI